MVVIDTSIIIDHLRQPSTQSKFISLATKYPKTSLSISVITIQELNQGQSTTRKTAQKDLLAIISPLKILPYTYQAAELAGKITRDTQGRTIQLADAAIAATTIINTAKLATLNTKDFKNIKGLELVKFGT